MSVWLGKKANWLPSGLQYALGSQSALYRVVARRDYLASSSSAILLAARRPSPMASTTVAAAAGNVATGVDVGDVGLAVLVDLDGVGPAFLQTLDGLGNERVGIDTDSHEHLVTLHGDGLARLDRAAATRVVGLAELHHVEYGAASPCRRRRRCSAAGCGGS